MSIFVFRSSDEVEAPNNQPRLVWMALYYLGPQVSAHTLMRLEVAKHSIWGPVSLVSRLLNCVVCNYIVHLMNAIHNFKTFLNKIALQSHKCVFSYIHVLSVWFTFLHPRILKHPLFGCLHAYIYMFV